MSASFSPRVGERFADRFELTAPLRGDGAVKAFLAFDHHAGREAELVLFDPACAHPKAWSAFARLVAAASEAKIAGLVLPRSVGSSPPVPPYCLAEPQAARGLDRLRDQGPVPWRRALIIGERAAEILEKALTATGAAHRVLTPSRCLVSVRDEVKVLDFGVAELEPGAAPDSSYRAPGDAGDSRSDVYALAVILLELISGQRCSTTPPPRLRSLVAAPQSVDDLLAKALAPEAGQRPPDIAAMRAELRELLGLSAMGHVRKDMAAPPLLAGTATGALPVREEAVEARDLDERTAPLPAARTAPAPMPRLERSVEPPVAAVPVGELLPLPEPEREPELATIRVAQRMGPERTVVADPSRRTGAQATLSERTVVADPSRRTGVQATVGRRTGAQATVSGGFSRVDPGRRTGAQATVSKVDPGRRTGAQATVSGGSSRVDPKRGTGALATVGSSSRIDPKRGTGALAAVSGSSSRIDPKRGTGVQATLSEHTVVAPGRRTGAQATVSEHTSADRTVILDPGRRTGAQASVPDRTVVLNPNAEAAVERTQVTPRDRVGGGRAEDVDAPSRADSTLLLPYPEDPSRSSAVDDDDGEAEEDFEAPGPTPRAHASAPARWSLRQILIVANVVLVVLVIAGLLVTRAS